MKRILTLIAAAAVVQVSSAQVTGTYAGPMPGVIGEVVGVSDIDSDNYLLVYPNPTNGPINVEFRTDEESEVSLQITDLRGRTVTTLVNAKRTAPGTFKMAVDLSEFGAGMYQAILKCNDRSTTTRIAITR